MGNKKHGCLGCLGTVFAIIGILVVAVIVLAGINALLESKSGGELQQSTVASIEPEDSTPDYAPKANEEQENVTDVPVTAGTTTPAEPQAGSTAYEITDTSFKYYETSIGTVEYFGIVEITNTGTTDLYLDSCTFDLEDNDGHLLQTDDFISSCPDIIAPGEKGYFYNGIGSMTIDDSVSLDNGVKLNPTVKVEKSRSRPHDYEVSDLSIRDSDLGPKVTGRVKNDTDEDDPLFYIQVIYKGKNGKVLAITGTTLFEFDAGAQQSFEISGMALPNGLSYSDIDTYKVVARQSYMQF